MKLHKIHNVDLSVCCAEQMVAYDYASTFRPCVKNAALGIGESAALTRYIAYVKKLIEEKYSNSEEFNAELIISIFCKNFANYCHLTYEEAHKLDDYYSSNFDYHGIGKAFPIPQ